MKMFIKAFLAVVWGIFYCKKLRLKHGKNSHIFLIRGKTGDIYLYLRFLKNYLEQNSITNYVLTGDGKNLIQIAKLYPYVTDKIYPLSARKGLALQWTWAFFGEENLKLHLSLMWDVDLIYNRCATRLTMPFNFTDSYYWFLFNLDRDKSTPVKAEFSSVSSKKIIEMGDTRIKKRKNGYFCPLCILCSSIISNAMESSCQRFGKAWL